MYANLTCEEKAEARSASKQSSRHGLRDQSCKLLFLAFAANEIVIYFR